MRSAYLAAYYAPGGYGLPFPGWGLLAGRYSRSSPLYSASFATWCSIAVLPCFSASRKVSVTRCGLPLQGTYAAYSNATARRITPQAVMIALCRYARLRDRLRGAPNTGGAYSERRESESYMV